MLVTGVIGTALMGQGMVLIKHIMDHSRLHVAAQRHGTQSLILKQYLILSERYLGAHACQI